MAYASTFDLGLWCATERLDVAFDRVAVWRRQRVEQRAHGDAHAFRPGTTSARPRRGLLIARRRCFMASAEADARARGVRARRRRRRSQSEGSGVPGEREPGRSRCGCGLGIPSCGDVTVPSASLSTASVSGPSGRALEAAAAHFDVTKRQVRARRRRWRRTSPWRCRDTRSARKGTTPSADLERRSGCLGEVKVLNEGGEEPVGGDPHCAAHPVEPVEEGGERSADSAKASSAFRSTWRPRARRAVCRRRSPTRRRLRARTSGSARMGASCARSAEARARAAGAAARAAVAGRSAGRSHQPS